VKTACGEEARGVEDGLEAWHLGKSANFLSQVAVEKRSQLGPVRWMISGWLILTDADLL
jgi:hypothetical protein